MLIPPRYHLTPAITKLLIAIEANKEIIKIIPVPQNAEINIHRRSYLKSALFSARIEGNDLTIENINQFSEKDIKKVEINNLLKALDSIKENSSSKLSLKDILQIHEIVTKGLINSNNSGKLRNNMEGIFNSAGVVVYLPPPPNQILPLLNQLLDYINDTQEVYLPIKAVISHYTFEKIHPFLDGSGRVGRAIIQHILLGYFSGNKLFLPLEEYLDNHREAYYRYLDEPEKDITAYVEFMLTAIDESGKQLRSEISRVKNNDPLDKLLPRRTEIYHIIKDHQIINFNTIKRRFMAINERTLRYDLKKLQEAGLINKLGTTKGVYYQIT